MYTTLVEEFVNNGHDVVVIAPGKGNTGVNIEKNIPVLRVKTLPIKNVSNIRKGISNLLLPHQYQRALNKYYKNQSFDLIITPTPPITLKTVALKLKKKYNSKVYLILRDIFPQNAVDLGFMKKEGLIHRYFRKQEKELYDLADYIGCMSQGNIDYVISHNPSLETEKLHELKNFQKVFTHVPLNKEKVKQKYQLKDKFVIVFGGNMGIPQQLENVLYLAGQASVYNDVVFLLLGEGVQMNNIARLAKERNLLNIKVHKTIPKDEYQQLISACDIGLISLNQNFTIPNIPSKSLDYFNVGIPVLASLDRATDFGDILDQHHLGLWSFADTPEGLFENFKTLYLDHNLRQDLGKNGKKYFVKYLIPEIAYNTIMEKINYDS